MPTHHNGQKLPKNKWAKSPCKECCLCVQNTNQVDRDCKDDAPHWVEWVKEYFITSSPHPQAQGDECYQCFACRRAHFKAYKTAASLAQDCIENPIVATIFNGLHTDRVKHGRFHKGEVVDVPTLITTVDIDDNYEDEADKFTVQTIELYASMRHWKWTSEEDLLNQLKEKRCQVGC